jgi:hypothetical protein
MKLDDIANLLAEKINQAHYIKHYLNNVFINGFQKGSENRESFAIEFAKWLTMFTQEFEDGDIRYWNIDKWELKTYEELLEIYKKQQE